MPPPTPGAYLKMRRCAARLSVADVAARIATVPRLAEHARVELIELIEADAAPASFATVVVFNNVYPFDIEVLAALQRIKLGADFAPPHLCRICACSDHDPCFRGTVFGPCFWVEDGLCSACATPPTRSATA
ncbi:XRE family transcriptional regulator [Sphingomonas populi]|uniref:XRE family transcriptional regulator n=1 Tax=Sphingomonas populi TaxID=2484750 RepID=A0A4Q6Y2M8_9SPHN|nr:XRE family transcriptional regulator [Sphingomonas populi]RZF64502.1 XRE family transcriptional regulator [Sphingomonas populi]